MSVFVFLGPSLPLAEARQHLDAEYLPPVSMGDLYVLAVTRARAGDHVAIIDGLFEQVPAVWHKECLFALSRGIHLYGAASMGALRAAELHPFGMRGVGRIFEAFRDFALENDDEVVVSHADAESEYRTLSTALVSIRFGMEDMVARGEIAPSLATEIVAAMAAEPYSRRNWAAVLKAAERAGASAECIARISEQSARPDAKAKDATVLLKHLALQMQLSHEAHRPNFIFQNTTFFNGLKQSMVLRVDAGRHASKPGDQAERSGIAHFVRAGGHGRDRWLESALLDRLVVEFTGNFTPNRKELREAELRIAEHNVLGNASSLRSWRSEQDISETEWNHLVDINARRFWLRREMADQLDSFLIARLKAEGQYDLFRESRRAALEEISRKSILKPSLHDFDLTPDILQSWYVERFGQMSPDPLSHANALNFETLREFIDALLECYLAERASTVATTSTAVWEREQVNGHVATK